MSFSIFKIFTLLFCFSTLCTYAADEVRDNATGVVFPSTVSLDMRVSNIICKPLALPLEKNFSLRFIV